MDKLIRVQLEITYFVDICFLTALIKIHPDSVILLFLIGSHLNTYYPVKRYPLLMQRDRLGELFLYEIPG